MSFIQRSEEFDLAFKFITQTQQNVFLTGKAGTGKTTFLRYLKANSYQNIVVAAPTGVAAINAEGVTLHSLFQLPFAPYIPNQNEAQNTLTKHSLLSQIKLNGLKRKVMMNMDLLVIDEVSMVAANTLDAIDIVLKSVRKNFNYPFGGVQVLFIGDLHQLPPVIKNDQAYLFSTIYKSPFFFDSHVLSKSPPVMVELKKIYRQKDGDFKDILNAVRENNLTPEQIRLLNKRLKPDFQKENNDGYITLTTHNAQADKINQDQLAKLKTAPQHYDAKIKGDFPESMFPADRELILKEGTQVMFLKNDSADKQYFNGKIGVVVELTHSSVFVQCDDLPDPIVIVPDVWQNVHYKINKEKREVEEEVLGEFWQYPLRLAWAITIHKSQGLTFDNLVVDAEKAFANGQVYVALSRVRSLEGLVLTSPISLDYLGASHNLKNWEATHNNPDQLPVLLEHAKIQTIQIEVLRIFDWSGIIYPMNDLNKLILSPEKIFTETQQEWFRLIFNETLELHQTAQKFQRSVVNLTNDVAFYKDQTQFNERLKAAAKYFLAPLQEIKSKILQHPFEVKTKKYSEPLDEGFEEICTLFHDVLHQLNYLVKNDFDLAVYLNKYRKNKSALIKVKSAYVGTTTKSRSLVSVSEIEHINLYQQIAVYRKVKAEEKKVKTYQIFTNEALKQICENLPKTEAGLLMIKGLGKVKVDQFGEDLLLLIDTYCQEHKVSGKDLF